MHIYIYIYIYICIALDLAVKLIWCVGIKGIYAQLTGRGLDLTVGVVVCKASVLDCLRGSMCLLYICIVLYLAMDVVVYKASVLDCLGGLDLAVGVVVCNTSMLD